MLEKQFLQHKSCKSQEMLEEAAAFDILKKNGVSGRDLKLVEKYLESDKIVQRPIILARQANNSLFFFMEHIKVISLMAMMASRRNQNNSSVSSWSASRISV